MVYFKACPRCNGDMVPNEDRYGCYIECIQCGYERDVQDSAKRTKSLPTRREKVTAEAA